MLALQLKGQVADARNFPKGQQAKLSMSTYILDAIYAHQQFPSMGWARTPSKTFVHTYWRLFPECSFLGVITHLSDHLVTPVYRMIFEQDPSFMSQIEMEALVDIANWYASTLDTFIRMYNVEKALQVLPNFSMDKLVMQEVTYHISKGLSPRLHKKKKNPWSALPFRIRLYKI